MEKNGRISEKFSVAFRLWGRSPRSGEMARHEGSNISRWALDLRRGPTDLARLTLALLDPLAERVAPGLLRLLLTNVCYILVTNVAISR